MEPPFRQQISKEKWRRPSVPLGSDTPRGRRPNLGIAEEVRERLIKAGITLNMERCIFNVKISFLGHLIEKSKVQLDPANLSAIVYMPHPTLNNELRRIMGMATYLTRSMPNVVQMLEPLSSTLSAKQDFMWNQLQQLDLDQ